MSRKIKPNKLFDDAQKADAEEIADKNEAAKVFEAEVLGVDSNSIVGNGRMSAEDAEKLAKYDAMEKSLASLSAEKAELEDKIAEYVSRIESFEDAANEIAQLESDKKALESKCKKLEEENSSLAKLEREVKSLKEENDQYLVKISELTFENASMTCQLSELEKKNKANGNVDNQINFRPSYRPQQQAYNTLAKPNRDAYNPYANNGYGTW